MVLQGVCQTIPACCSHWFSACFCKWFDLDTPMLVHVDTAHGCFGTTMGDSSQYCGIYSLNLICILSGLVQSVILTSLLAVLSLTCLDFFPTKDLLTGAGLVTHRQKRFLLRFSALYSKRSFHRFWLGWYFLRI